MFIFRITILFLFSNLLVAGPYGLEGGMPLTSVVIKQSIDNNIKEIIVPYPDNNNISTYIGTFSKRYGLCKIIAVGNDIPTDIYGKKLQKRYKQMQTMLSKEYGRPSVTFDMLYEGSVLTSVDQWTLSLMMEERILVTVYNLSTKFKDGIGIVLEAMAKEKKIGYFLITYEFGNLNKCMLEVEMGDLFL